MLVAISIGASALSYFFIYAAYPGERVPRGPPRRRARRRLGAGGALMLLSLATSTVAFGPLIGPVMVLCMMMTVGSTCVLVGPVLRSPRPNSGRTS